MKNARDHLDGGRFARPIGTEKSDDLSWQDPEADILHGGDTAIAAKKVL
jgi:hypothetical protein